MYWTLFKIFFVLTILLFVIGIINIIVNKTDYLSYITEKSVHLVWKKPKYLEIQYNFGLIILFFTIIGFIYPKNKGFGLFLLLYLIITGSYSYMASPNGKNIFPIIINNKKTAAKNPPNLDMATIIGLF